MNILKTSFLIGWCFTFSSLIFAQDDRVTGVFEHSSGNVIVTIGTKDFELGADTLFSEEVTRVYYGNPDSDILYPLIMNPSRLGAGANSRNSRRKMLTGFFAPDTVNPNRYARLVFSGTQSEKMPKLMVQCDGNRACFRHNSDLSKRVKSRIETKVMEFAPEHSAKYIKHAYRSLGERDGIFLLIETERYLNKHKGTVHLGRAGEGNFITMTIPFMWDPGPTAPHHKKGLFGGEGFERISFEDPETKAKFDIHYVDHDPNKILLTIGSLKEPLQEFQIDNDFLNKFGLPTSEYLPLRYATPCDLLRTKME